MAELYIFFVSSNMLCFVFLAATSAFAFAAKDVTVQILALSASGRGSIAGGTKLQVNIFSDLRHVSSRRLVSSITGLRVWI